MMAKKAKKAPKKPVKKKPVEKKPNLATTIRFGIPPRKRLHDLARAKGERVIRVIVEPRNGGGIRVYSDDLPGSPCPVRTTSRSFPISNLRFARC
jgi:hypothetical protein